MPSYSLTRLLNHLWLRGPAPGQLPQNLWIQQDNCPRECKNQIMFRVCIALVLLGVSRSVVLAYLRKGHTHEDLDQDGLSKSDGVEGLIMSW